MCRYVDEAIIGAPLELTKEMVESYKIKKVVVDKNKPVDPRAVQVAKELGILVEVDTTETLTTGEIVQRVVSRHADYLERQRKKLVC